MNGIHDMGGMHGFGPVEVEENEPVFHHRWEGRIFAMRAAARAGGLTSLDEMRFANESLDPAEYLALSYYGRWMRSFELKLVDDDVLEPGELDAWIAGDLLEPVPAPELLGRFLFGARRKRPGEPRFVVGQRVRARNHQTSGHTRLPGYARSRRGVIAGVHPAAWVLPDTNAHRRGENPEILYSVEFAGAELWGDAAEAGTFVNLDLFESYLEEEDNNER